MGSGFASGIFDLFVGRAKLSDQSNRVGKARLDFAHTAAHRAMPTLL
jgi:hypothetical protein